MVKNNAYELLVAHQVKPSLQRMALLDDLLQNRTHPTVDEVYTRLYPKIPTLSKTTVYNTLRLFAEKGVAQMLTIEEQRLRFDADMRPHAHFLCKKCGKVYDLFGAKHAADDSVETIEGHQVLETQVYYHGICKKCLLKENKVAPLN